MKYSLFLQKAYNDYNNHEIGQDFRLKYSYHNMVRKDNNSFYLIKTSFVDVTFFYPKFFYKKNPVNQ